MFLLSLICWVDCKTSIRSTNCCIKQSNNVIPILGNRLGSYLTQDVFNKNWYSGSMYIEYNKDLELPLKMAILGQSMLLKARMIVVEHHF